MARTYIEGTVTRTIRDRGFVVTENWTNRQGEPGSQNYTVWVDNPSSIPGENVTVKVNGNLSARIERFTNSEGKDIEYVGLHVNQPNVTLVDAPGLPVDTSPAWPDNDVPF